MDPDLLAKHKFQFIRFCAVFHRERYRGGIHINDDSHLMHVTRGQASLLVDGKRHHLTPGWVVAIPAYVEFVFDIEPGYEMLNLHYRLWLDNDHEVDELGVLPYVFKPAYFNTCEKLLRRLQEDAAGQTSTGSFKLAGLAHQVVLEHLHGTGTTVGLQPADHRVRRVCRYLAAADRDRYDAEKAAAVGGLSVSQLNRVFRRAAGVSPQKFWARMRFGRVCLALKTNPAPISKIAADFGFVDAAYFSRWFRKLCGLSPAAYRQRLATPEALE